MAWLPKLQLSLEEYEAFLTDLEKQKVKQLHEAMRKAPLEPERSFIEKEIYQIILSSIRRKKEVGSGLEKWLNDASSKKVEHLKSKMARTPDQASIFNYEADIYQIYLENVSRHNQSEFQHLVQKYIEWLKNCETRREADLIGRVIADLLKMAHSNGIDD